jgi:hypothetical protein
MALPALNGLYALGELKHGAVPLCAIEIGRDESNPPVVAWQRFGSGTKSK